MPHILVILAHPQLEQSRVASALAAAARTLSGGDQLQVAVRDLYALFPDYLIDVAAEQAALADVQLPVWLHPVHWYGHHRPLKHRE